MAQSSIEWTSYTWNPTTGCNKVTAGCKECYAIRMAWRLMHSPHAAVAQKYAGTVEKTAGGQLNWTGKVNLLQSELTIPLQQKKPAVFFVDSMSDLFHQNVPIHFIANVFAIMWICNHHTFQILTKRDERMPEVLNNELFYVYLHAAVQERLQKEVSYEEVFSKMPLKNVWLGVSVEDQEQANIRIPHLLNTPAAIRFLSCEPLLGPIDFNNVPVTVAINEELRMKSADIDWVIAGGESGPKARPMSGKWVRSLRDQCAHAGIPFFFKQWGEFVSGPTPPLPEGLKLSHVLIEGKSYKNVMVEGDTMFIRMGKKAAGHLLDGIEHKAFPSVHVTASPVPERNRRDTQPINP